MNESFIPKEMVVNKKYYESEWGIATLELTELRHLTKVVKKWDITKENDYSKEYNKAINELKSLVFLKDDRDFSLNIKAINGDYRRTKYTMTHLPTGTEAHIALHASDVMQNISLELKKDLAKKLGVTV